MDALVSAAAASILVMLWSEATSVDKITEKEDENDYTEDEADDDEEEVLNEVDDGKIACDICGKKYKRKQISYYALRV